MGSNDTPDGPDAERTILIPNPGGQRVGARAMQVQAPRDGALQQSRGQGLNPLVRAANPLLGLAWQLRSQTQAPDMDALRSQLMAAVRAFESEARAARIDIDTLAAARFALCTFVDEAISGTPWGGGVWGQRSLLVAFHNEAWGGEKFFTVLQRLAQDARANIDALELFYLCLALGMEGRYRVMERGREQLADMRERLYGLIRRERGAAETELSVQWRGPDLRSDVRSGRALAWLAALAAGVLLLTTQIWFAHILKQESGAASDALLALGDAATALAPPAPPAAPRPAPQAPLSLAQKLAPDVARGLLAVSDAPGRSLITLRGDGLFASGSSAIASGAEPLLARIGEALRDTAGTILVIGHTDNQPLAASARLGSNRELSAARADAVVRVLSVHAGPADRYRLEGRGDAEPVASNATAAGRARNRRVDIEVLAPSGAF